MCSARLRQPRLKLGPRTAGRRRPLRGDRSAATRVASALTLAWALAVAWAQPAPTLFEAPWSDLTDFVGDLPADLVEAALALESAPVYHLAWTLRGTSTLRASQEVRVVNGSDADWHELYFHLLPNVLGGELSVERVLVNGQPARSSLSEGGRLLRVDPVSPVAPGGALVVGVEYQLDIPEAGGRNYGILGRSDGSLSLAHAYALLAVYREGGWDLDPPPRYGDLVHAESAFFRVEIDAPAELSLVTGGRVLRSEARGERQFLEVAAGPVRDFYLAAGQDLELVELRAREVIVRGHAPPGGRAAMEAALADAVAALEVFTRLLGPYPYLELDIVAISTSALGVEFPGIIALRRQLLSPTEGDRWLESTVVHEVAHQWFYALVGNDQVSEPWLDESLTQYLTLRYFLRRYGTEGYRDFRESLLSRWDEVDRNKRPIGLPVAAYGMNEYGAIVYGLGPLVIEWLAGLMERPDFDEFLRDYVERNRFALARGEEFIAMAEVSCECALDEFFETWVTGP
jgi:hypothetical protein